MTNPKTTRIRELNELLRTIWLAGKVLMTGGIQSLPANIQSEIAEAVQTFSAFTPDNTPGPHGEHDFGSLTVAGLPEANILTPPATPPPAGAARA